MNLQENIKRIKILMETNVDSSDIYYHGTDNPNFNDDELKINERGGIRDYEEAASEALYDGDWSVLESRPFIEALKEKGFDSIYIDNSPHYNINHKDEIFTGKDIAIFYPELAIPVKNKYD